MNKNLLKFNLNDNNNHSGILVELSSCISCKISKKSYQHTVRGSG